ncbi:MAG: ABC transporter ATP-binding protein [Planctomycetota bacterium]|jgi:lipopolysaccharide transport system ATP-binding protein
MATRVRFDSVSKRFRKGESATALRDLIPNLLRRLRGRPRTDEREFWALRDVSFEVREGEVLGIIGPNGAGKSTTLKLTAGILRPNGGSVSVDGSLSALIEVAAGFHPDLTGRENVFLNGSVLGLKRRVIRERFDEIIDFAELREFVDTPVKRYSTGMHMRLGFSVAVHVDPEIFLIDEVLAVGDLAFRQKCMRRIRDLREKRKTILFVSHKMRDVRAVCDRVIYLREGRIHEQGDPVDVTRVFEADMKGKSQMELAGLRRSQRAGDSPVTIRDVGVTDLGGRETDRVVAGEGFRVRVRVDVAERLRSPVLSVMLLRSDDICVCHASTRLLGPEVPGLEGECEFEVEFEHPPLVEDHYTVETVVWNEEMNIPWCQHRNPTVFIEDPHVPLTRPGVCHPRARFVRVLSGGEVLFGES